jgi:hypothetical protein
MQPQKKIARILGGTVALGAVVTACLMFIPKDVGEASMGAFFGGIVWTILILFIETIVLAVIYRKHFRSILPVLAPWFLISFSLVGYLTYISIKNYFDTRAIDIPANRARLVTDEQYTADSLLVVHKSLADLEQHGRKVYGRDTVLSTSVVDIWYAADREKFFAVLAHTIIPDSMDAAEHKGASRPYSVDYIVGKKNPDKTWKLGTPDGNEWVTDFESIAKLKREIEQYYYHEYSINSSSSKPEIWQDTCLFHFKE